MATAVKATNIESVESRVRQQVQTALGERIEIILANGLGSGADVTALVELYRDCLRIVLAVTRFEQPEWNDCRALLPRIGSEYMLRQIQETGEMPPEDFMELRYAVAMLRSRRGVVGAWHPDLKPPASTFSRGLAERFHQAASSEMVRWSADHSSLGHGTGSLGLDQVEHLFGDRNFTPEQLSRRRWIQWNKIREQSGLSAEKFAKFARVPRSDFYARWLKGRWKDDSDQGRRILALMFAMRQDQYPSPGRRASRR